jgi:hypothetical protein
MGQTRAYRVEYSDETGARSVRDFTDLQEALSAFVAYTTASADDFPHPDDWDVIGWEDEQTAVYGYVVPLGHQADRGHATVSLSYHGPSAHAHVHTVGQDCDGMQEWSYVMAPDEGETRDAFRGRMVADHLPDTTEGAAVGVFFDRHGFSYTEPTDEGYRAVEVTWCTDDDMDTPRGYRDHAAEAAGY